MFSEFKNTLNGKRNKVYTCDSVQLAPEKSLENDDLVSIIIINYNGGDYILDCVDSVFKTSNCNFEVILIDNNSIDNSSNLCKEKFDQIRLFQSDKNLAMAARNIGIKKAKGDFIAFLDADTIVEPNWLEVLLESYKKHGDGLYQGKLLQRDNHEIIESCGDFTNIFGFGFARGRGQLDIGKYDEFQTISFPVGACTFSSTEIIKKIGFIDESDLFFLMLDDLDYGWRGWSMGIPSFYEPEAVIYHLGSPVLQWSTQKFFFLERNRWICLLTLYSTKTLVKIFPHLLLIDIGMYFHLLSQGLSLTKIKAFFSILKMYSSIKKRRRDLEKKKKITDKKIIENFVDIVEVPKTMKGHPSHFFSNGLKSLSESARRII